MMIACGDYVIPGNKMPPNNAEAEAAYAIFIDMIENGWLTVSSESLCDGKTRIRWKLLKEQEAVEPVLDKQTGRMWLCGNCGSYVGFEDNDPHDPNEYDKYCRECGRPVLWEGR